MLIQRRFMDHAIYDLGGCDSAEERTAALECEDATDLKSPLTMNLVLDEKDMHLQYS